MTIEATPATGVQTISSSLPQHRSSETTSDPQKAATIAVLLTRLAVHYYRPDFTEGQAKSLIRDMVEDLSAYGVSEIDQAIKDYRRNGLNRFFPTSGQLLAPILERRKELHQDAKISSKPLPNESRPLMWWMLPRKLWKQNWREADAPDDAWVYDLRTGIRRAAFRLS